MKYSQNVQDSEPVMNDANKENHESYYAEDDPETLNSESQEYSYFLNEDEYHIEIEVIAQDKSHQCRKCKMIFLSNNKLHRHISECRKVRLTVKSAEAHQIETYHVNVDIDRIIVSKAKPNLFKGLAFKS
jgi:hypothetical protein